MILLMIRKKRSMFQLKSIRKQSGNNIKHLICLFCALNFLFMSLFLYLYSSIYLSSDCCGGFFQYFFDQDQVRIFSNSSSSSSSSPNWPFPRIQIGSETRNDLTIVTIYFKLNHSKFSDDAYKEWARNFFSSANNCPLIIFTDPGSADFLAGLARQTPNAKTIFLISDIWQVMKQLETERAHTLNYRALYEGEQFEKDPEKALHSPELYAIWNSKAYLVSKAIEHNIYRSKYYMYTDIGAFRYRPYSEWPDYEFTLLTLRNLNHRVLFGKMNREPTGPILSSKTDFVQGGFFAGSQQALARYALKFYEIHDEHLTKGVFVGKDQTIMNIFSVMLHPELSCLLWEPHLDDKCIRNFGIWFFYQFYFAHAYKVEPTDWVNSTTRYEVRRAVSRYNRYRCRHEIRSSTVYTTRKSIRCNGGLDEIGVEKCFKCDIINYF